MYHFVYLHLYLNEMYIIRMVKRLHDVGHVYLFDILFNVFPKTFQ